MKLPFAAPAAWCLLAAALFGASTPVARALLDGIGPITLAGLFYLGAALGTAPWALTGHAPAARRRQDLPRLVAAVAFGGVIGPVLVLLGLRAAPAWWRAPAPPCGRRAAGSGPLDAALTTWATTCRTRPSPYSAV